MYAHILAHHEQIDDDVDSFNGRSMECALQDGRRDPDINKSVFSRKKP